MSRRRRAWRFAERVSAELRACPGLSIEQAGANVYAREFARKVAAVATRQHIKEQSCTSAPFTNGASFGLDIARRLHQELDRLPPDARTSYASGLLASTAGMLCGVIGAIPTRQHFQLVAEGLQELEDERPSY